MTRFKTFKTAVQKQFDRMSKGQLFIVDVDKDLLWDTYLSNFAEGDDPQFRERTEHDCNCCRGFIRKLGAVVAIVDGELLTIWDTAPAGRYEGPANALATLVRSRPIKSPFFHHEGTVGTDSNADNELNVRWQHFYQVLPSNVVKHHDDIASDNSNHVANHDVLKRSVQEISAESIEVVLDLIADNSLYRGAEHKRTVELIRDVKKEYEAATNKDLYLWSKSLQLGHAARVKNTVIGTLLSDITEGYDLEDCVKSFESKVAPHNYKRTTALVTKGMVDKARKKVEKLGIEDSLHRRYATTEDLTVNNVLFADRSAKEDWGVFELVDVKASPRPKKDSIEEISISDFVENVLPRIESMEIMVENRHSGNLFSLIAPVHQNAPNILKWDNNFSWTYNGEVTDSIKERVKNAGGCVDAYIRTSLSWYNTDDLDLHVKEPAGPRGGRGFHIYYGDTRSRETGGNLDVDMNAGGRISTEPVENIVWPSADKMRNGTYRVYVHQYSKRNSSDGGFEVELEFNGEVHNFLYEKIVPQSNEVEVCTFEYKNGVVTVKPSLPSTQRSQKIWGVDTEQYSKVNMMLLSPNHWDDSEVGNKHYFFVLDGCQNPDKARGFYNEFLRNDLNEHRKVFEILGSKMKAEPSEEQLSGVGFSSTKSNSLLARVSGSYSRTLKIKF